MKTPRFWRSKNLISTALLPLSWLYALGAHLDRATTTPQHAPRPVIAIGNVTAGGAGKTPTTIALIPILQHLGFIPHILTRGYKGEELAAHHALPTDHFTKVGDEALLLVKHAPTWAGANRLASADAAAASGATILVCDDALHHHALKKDLSLLVIDGAYGLGNNRLLPAGPLRESLQEALKRTDAVILIGNDSQNLSAKISLPIFRAKIQPSKDTSFLNNKTWLAFAGLAHPQKFYDTLRELGANVIATRDFPDHHAYTAADLASLKREAAAKNATLITTEKDAVKLPASENIQTLPITLTFDDPTAFTTFLKSKLTP